MEVRMKPRARLVTLVFSFIAAVTLGCDENLVPTAEVPELHKHAPPPPPTDSTCKTVVSGHHKGNRHAPLELLCAIQAPGPAVLTQGQKGFVDGDNYYLADQSNKGLSIFDAERLAFIGRVGGMAGNLPAGGGTALTNGPGPSAIAFSDHNTAWVSDGNSTTWIVDIKKMMIIGSVNTSIAACDDGTNHYCGRANEIAYDPEHNQILVQNPSPLALAAPHGAIDTYLSIVSARPPYKILGTVSFPQHRGQEAPVYNRRTNRWLTAVSGRQVVVAGAVTELYHQYLAVINPESRPLVVEDSFLIDCTALGITVPVTPANPTGRTFGINDPPPTLPHSQLVVVPGCGRPIIMNARTGAIVNSGITEVGGGNETWFNRGDGNFYVTVGNTFGAINARTGQLSQTLPDTGGANPAAFSGLNRVFTIVQAAATPTACTAFGYQASGCITVFGHTGRDDHDGDDDDDDGHGHGHGHDDDHGHGHGHDDGHGHGHD